MKEYQIDVQGVSVASKPAKEEWIPPTLITYSTEKTAGKDFANLDEGSPTSGPS